MLRRRAVAQALAWLPSILRDPLLLTTHRFVIELTYFLTLDVFILLLCYDKRNDSMLRKYGCLIRDMIPCVGF